MLSLTFRDADSAHDDLVLDVAGTQRVCDSYYLLLDPSEPEENPGKTRRVLVRLLQQWLQLLKSVQDAAAVFLPYDFSDQYTGCLRCTRRGHLVEMVSGYSRIVGWRVAPSDISAYVGAVRDFQRWGGIELSVPREELLRAIEANLRQLAAAR